MNKIAIVGPSGAGKSTLAQQLGPLLQLKIYHLDRLFWQSRWRRESRETRIDRLQNIVREKSWVIEGTYLNSSQLHLQEADAIIFLDMSPFICLWRRIKRHRKFKGRPGRDIPKESSDKLTLFGILKILFFPLGARRKLENKLSKFPEKVIRLQSPEEVKEFLAELELHINQKTQSAATGKKKKDLALVRQ